MEQIKQIREQLIEQIDKSFPEESKQQTIQEINSMSDKELIEFLRKNNMIQQDASGEGQQCVFCAIANKQMPSTEIDENEDAIAVLEINPISKGHTIVIPKEHITKPEDLSDKTKELSTKIGEKLKKIFNVEKVEVAIRNILGHESINIIPIYKDETIDSPRTQSNPEELAKIKSEIDGFIEQKAAEPKEVEEPEKPKEINEENTWLPRRIP